MQSTEPEDTSRDSAWEKRPSATRPPSNALIATGATTIGPDAEYSALAPNPRADDESPRCERPETRPVLSGIVGRVGLEPTTQGL